MKTLILTTALVVLTTLMFAQQETASLSTDKVLVTDQVKCVIFPNSSDMVTMIVDKGNDNCYSLFYYKEKRNENTEKTRSGES